MTLKIIVFTIVMSGSFVQRTYFLSNDEFILEDVFTSDELVALGENITYWNGDMNHIKTYSGDTLDTMPITFPERGGWTMNGAIPNNEGQSNYREIELNFNYYIFSYLGSSTKQQ